jgi:hypothetical protein
MRPRRDADPSLRCSQSLPPHANARLSLPGELKLFTLHLPGGQRVNLPTLEAVGEFVREANASDYRVEEKHPQVIADTPERIRKELDVLAARFGVEEFIIDNPVPTFADRFAAVELLGNAALARAA